MILIETLSNWMLQQKLHLLCTNSLINAQYLGSEAATTKVNSAHGVIAFLLLT